jgi:multidrug efflux pump subunit AcrB
VVSAIPFGLIGAVLGHMLLGLDVSLLSLSGMIAVSGVVVNDNLVLVDYINRAREKGLAVASAIREAGVARFRPIMLTSLTTFAGLTPLMLEKSVQAQFLIPMAVSLAFGVIFATTVSLLLIPSAYHILEDIAALFRRKSPEALRAEESPTSS